MKIKVTLRHNRTKKIRTEVMDEREGLFNYYTGEVGNKSCSLRFDSTGAIGFSIKSYTVMKVEGQTFVWKLKEKK